MAHQWYPHSHVCLHSKHWQQQLLNNSPFFLSGCSWDFWNRSTVGRVLKSTIRGTGILHQKPERFSHTTSVFAVKAGDKCQDLRDKTVLVLGLGISGRAAVKLALARGANVVAVDSNKQILPLQEDSQFTNTDFSQVKVVLGVVHMEIFATAERIVVSPGISLEQYNLQHWIQIGRPVVSELEFAAEVLPKEVKVVAVTGTNGKSTVTSFTGQILKHAGIPCFVGGNYGFPLSQASLHCLHSPAQVLPFQVAVVEVSSYQMEIRGQFFLPSVAVVLNFTPDHLDRHRTLRNYGESKCRLFSHMKPSDLAVIPSDSKLLEEIYSLSGSQGTRAWIGDLPGVKLYSMAQCAKILVPTTRVEMELDVGVLNAIGIHNAYNAGSAAFLALGLDMGLKQETIQSALPTLQPPPHRMQIVCKDEDGVLWVDDSKATNVEAVYAGLKGSFKQQAVVLLGGLAKVLDKEGNIGFHRLVEVLQHHRAVITFGAAGERIKKDLEVAGLSIPCFQCKGLEEAVDTARSISQPGDAVVLTPGCSSFDEFQSFEHRGQVFSTLARRQICG
eukprot:c21207_g1_i5 orf=257-1927(+)